MSILICYDGSPSAERTLTVAQHVLNGSSTVLLHVWSPPDRIVADAFAGREDDDGPTYEHLEALSKERADEILSQGSELAEKLGVHVEPRDERNRSSVSQTILEVAEELDAKLIVTGTHGGTAVQSGLLGSVSNALVHSSRRPVLVVPEHDTHAG